MKLLVHLILQSFQKIAKFKSVCGCGCVGVHVRAYVYMNKCDKPKQCSCYMQIAISRITLRNMMKFQKFIN